MYIIYIYKHAYACILLSLGISHHDAANQMTTSLFLSGFRHYLSLSTSIVLGYEQCLLESHLHGKLVIKMLGTFLDRTIGHGIGSSVQGRPIFRIIATLLIKVLITVPQRK